MRNLNRHLVQSSSTHTRMWGGALAALTILATACSSSSTPSTTSTTDTANLTGSITVSAASSLTTAFSKLASTFEAAHHGTIITFNFGSSGALATQIIQGAPSDVFASASPKNMDMVSVTGAVLGKPVTFARNSLEIVVKPGNPLAISSLADLTKAHVVAICVSTAPCGATADQALKNASVTLPSSQVTLGPDVEATVAAVTTGDADAAIVYVTNAKKVGALGTGVGVPIPASVNVTTSYPIAAIKSTKDKSLTLAWIAYVLGPTGQKVLRTAGFLPAG